MAEAQAAIKEVNRAGDDYYKILGVSKSAADDEIKKAYRKLALRLHPDKCKEDGAEEAFKRVGEAFSVLSDAQKRAAFDQYGVDGIRDRGGGGPGGPGGINPEDIFEAFFGGGGLGGAPMGGTTFVRGGNGTTFRFSSGPGGPNVFHFNMGPGGMGGPGLRHRSAAAQRQREREQEEADMPELPPWVERLRDASVLLGPLLPFVVVAVLVVGFMLFATVLQIVMSRMMFFLPIMYLTEGRTKWILMSSVLVLTLVGII